MNFFFGWSLVKSRRTEEREGGAGTVPSGFCTEVQNMEDNQKSDVMQKKGQRRMCIVYIFNCSLNENFGIFWSFEFCQVNIRYRYPCAEGSGKEPSPEASMDIIIVAGGQNWVLKPWVMASDVVVAQGNCRHFGVVFELSLGGAIEASRCICMTFYGALA